MSFGCIESTMNPGIWSRLPKELLEKTLLHVPVGSLLRMRCVCKSWNTWIGSRKFLELRRKISTTNLHAWFLSRGPSSCNTECISFPAYDPAMDRWFDLPCISLDRNKGSFELVASAGGLLLVKLSGIGAVAKALYVVNPLRRLFNAVSLLPEAFGVEPTYTAMVHNASTNSYQILMASNQSRHRDRTTRFYDSAVGSWTTKSQLPRRFCCSDFAAKAGVLCNGWIYWLGFRGYYFAVGFNLRTGVWSKTRWRIPAGVVGPHLVERNGSLLLVGGTDKLLWRMNCYPAPKSIGIWELDRKKGEWIETLRLPKPMVKELRKKISFEDFCCVGRNGFLYISDDVIDRVVAYNMQENSWHWLPAPSRPGHSWTIFEPSFDATV
ncbi:hypothetical protein CY35_08G047300 [Sphagnum magellanicum]|nr:hypothetical protein CY35_08G047300 [Sphagnum magellanicum]